MQSAFFVYYKENDLTEKQILDMSSKIGYTTCVRKYE